ncbi:MAG: hypothetical protein JXR45_16660 [Deltaproteobacteria bacterium]|nr:hypothetical protein [Deltaproteobacteria bacterium]
MNQLQIAASSTSHNTVLRTTIHALINSIFTTTGSDDTDLVVGILSKLSAQNRICSSRNGLHIEFVFPDKTDLLQCNETLDSSRKMGANASYSFRSEAGIAKK